MPENDIAVGRTVQMNTDLDSALEQVEAALKSEGFGILTEIDVKATLKKKIDVDFRPYRILGACNPPLAYQALKTAPQVGLLLPCNVTVSKVAAGKTEVSLVNPMSLVEFTGNPDLQSIAEEAKEGLERVADALEEK